MPKKSAKEIVQELNSNFALSLGAISEETGISQKTLTQVKKGKRILPEEQRALLESLFEEQEKLRMLEHRGITSTSYKNMFSSLLTRTTKSPAELSEEKEIPECSPVESDVEDDFPIDADIEAVEDIHIVAHAPKVESVSKNTEKEKKQMYTAKKIAKDLDISMQTVYSRISKIRSKMGQDWFSKNSTKTGQIRFVNATIYKMIKDMGQLYSPEEAAEILGISKDEFKELFNSFSENYKNLHVKTGKIDSAMLYTCRVKQNSRSDSSKEIISTENSINDIKDDTMSIPTVQHNTPGYTYTDKVAFLLNILGLSVKSATQQISNNAPNLQSSRIRRYLQGQEIPKNEQDVYLLAISNFFHVDKSWLIEDEPIAENEIKATFNDVGEAIFVLEDTDQANDGDFVYLSINGNEPELYHWHLRGINASLERSNGECLDVNLCKDDVKLLGRASCFKKMEIFYLPDSENH